METKTATAPAKTPAIVPANKKKNKDENRLSANKEKALAALVNSTSIAEAARMTGLSDKAIFKYLQDPEFKKRYLDMRTEIMNQAFASAQVSVSKPIAALLEIVEDTRKSSQSARVSAARVLLDMCLKAVEWEVVIKRLEAVEEEMNTRKGVGRQW